MVHTPYSNPLFYSHTLLPIYSLRGARQGPALRTTPGPAPPSTRQGHAIDRSKPALPSPGQRGLEHPRPGAQPHSTEASSCYHPHWLWSGDGPTGRVHPRDLWAHPAMLDRGGGMRQIYLAQSAHITTQRAEGSSPQTTSSSHLAYTPLNRQRDPGQGPAEHPLCDLPGSSAWPALMHLWLPNCFEK